MNRAQQILDEMARPRKKPVQPAAPAPAPAELMNPKEMEDFALTALGYGDFIKMLSWIERGADFGGRVYRTGYHYSHSNTVSFDARGDWAPDMTEEEQAEFDAVYANLEKQIEEEVRETSDKIYRALEREYDDQHSEEVVAENIRANEYEFDENGRREDGGGFQYDQLDASAKEKAIEWYNSADFGDNFWSEHTIEEWKAELTEMGFNDPDISWSGFWSQGDGASFTCSSFDFDRYAKFFMTGKNKERGRPYTDEKYAKEYAAQAAAQAQQIVPPGPQQESHEDIDLDKFATDAVYHVLSTLADYDPKHERMNAPWEKHYRTSARSERFLIRMSIFDAIQGDKGGNVRVDFYIQQLQGPYQIMRKVKFFVPDGDRSKLVLLLHDFWNQAKGIIERKDQEGRKVCNSITHRLSLMAGIWSREHQAAKDEFYDAKAREFVAANPIDWDAYNAKLAARVAKMPKPPSEEKLKLRADMKKWKQERDAAQPKTESTQTISGDELVKRLVSLGTSQGGFSSYTLSEISQQPVYRLETVPIASLLQSDESFAEYVAGDTRRDYEGDPDSLPDGGFRGEDGGDFVTPSHDIAEPVVVINGEIRDGYNRAASLHDMGRPTVLAWVATATQQESEDDDLMNQMGDVATRSAVKNLGSVMNEQPVRYMNGSKAYHWSKTTPDWRWKIKVDVTVYDEQLPQQPWDADITVQNTVSGRSYRCDKLVVTPDEKNKFGIGVMNLIPLVKDIAERSWDDNGPMKELEIAFNKTLGPRQTASPNHKISTFYEY